MRLRDYQENGITLLRKSYSKQKKEGVERNNSLLVVGTGGGKTLTTTALFKSAIDKGSRCLFLTNRISLVLQTIRVFMENDLDPSVCWAGNPNGFIPSRKLQVACTETLRRRVKKAEFLAEIGKFDFIVIDEVHITASDPIMAMAYSMSHQDTAIIGLTATPWTPSLAKHFSTKNLCCPIMPHELVERGFLVPARVASGAVPIDVEELEIDKKTGDYTDGSAERAVRKVVLYDDIIKTYRQYADGKRAIVFAASKAHAFELQERFLREDISAAVVVAETPAEQRENTFNACRAGSIPILISVDALSEGLDVVEIEAVLLCRPTKALNKYIQRVGRGARPAQGKNYFWVLDFVGCVHEHGMPFDEREYYIPKPKKKSQSEASEREKFEPKKWTCVTCFEFNEGEHKQCRHCGTEKPRPLSLKAEQILHEGMKEVTSKVSSLQKLPKEKKQAIYSALIGHFTRLGVNPNRAYYAYKAYFGIGPNGLRKEAGHWTSAADEALKLNMKETKEWRKNKPTTTSS